MKVEVMRYGRKETIEVNPYAIAYVGDGGTCMKMVTGDVFPLTKRGRDTVLACMEKHCSGCE